jgi:hypothetical protein
MSNWPTWDQIKGIAERLIGGVLLLLVAKGFIGKDDVAVYGPAILLLLAAIYGWYTNRPKAIVQSAAALPNTTVVTTPALAKSTPEPNIVSSAEMKVEPKTEEEVTAQLNRDQLR